MITSKGPTQKRIGTTAAHSFARQLDIACAAQVCSAARLTFSLGGPEHDSRWHPGGATQQPSAMTCRTGAQSHLRLSASNTS